MENIQENHLCAIRKTSYESSSRNAWIRLFRRHQSIRRLHLADKNCQTDFNFTEFTDELPDLVEIRLQSKLLILIEDISWFIRERPKLIKCQFLIFQCSVLALQQFYGQFENEWNVQYIWSLHQYRGASFVKRHSKEMNIEKCIC